MNYTPKQYKILQLISEYQKTNGYSPSYAELAKTLNISTVTVFEHIKALEHKGAVRRRHHAARSVEILLPEFNNNITLISVIGTIEDGQPIAKYDKPETLVISGFNDKCYALCMIGTKNEYIINNDILIVENKLVKHGQVIITYDEDNRTNIKRHEHGSVITVFDVVCGIVRRI